FGLGIVDESHRSGSGSLRSRCADISRLEIRNRFPKALASPSKRGGGLPGRVWLALLEGMESIRPSAFSGHSLGLRQFLVARPRLPNCLLFLPIRPRFFGSPL